MAKKSIEITGIPELAKEVEKELTRLGIKETSEIAVEMIKDNIEPFSDTGALEKSIKYKLKRGKGRGKNSAVIISNLPYARIQDLGGRIMITAQMRKKMWVLFRETRNPMFKRIAITKKKFITIPAKHYTKINKTVLARLAQLKIDNKVKRKKY